MAAAGLFSERDAKIMRQLLEDYKHGLINFPSRPSAERAWAEAEDHQAPETYVVLPPAGGIPARSGNVPGDADCDLYAIRDNSLQSINRTQKVFNLSESAVTEYAAATRDKFGKWLTILGGGGIQHGIVNACLGRGFYRVELADWVPDIPMAYECPGGPGTGTGTGTTSLGLGDCYCCDPNAECGIVGTNIRPDERAFPTAQLTGTGEFVTAFDPRIIPLVVGGHCIMSSQGATDQEGPTGTGTSPGGPPTIVYPILTGEYSLVGILQEDFACCVDPVTKVQSVQRISCVTYIVEGVSCTGDPTPCAEECC